jgi:hypothetical protein
MLWRPIGFGFKAERRRCLGFKAGDIPPSHPAEDSGREPELQKSLRDGKSRRPPHVHQRNSVSAPALSSLPMYTFQAIRKHGRQRIQSNINFIFPRFLPCCASRHFRPRLSQWSSAAPARVRTREQKKCTFQEDRMVDITSAVLDAQVT